jgi:hypothetical protein
MHLKLCFILRVHGKYPNRNYSIGTGHRRQPLFSVLTSIKSANRMEIHAPSTSRIEYICGMPSLFLDFARVARNSGYEGLTAEPSFDKQGQCSQGCSPPQHLIVVPAAAAGCITRFNVLKMNEEDILG